MFINTQPMFTTICRSIKCRCLIPLDDRTTEEICCGLENVPRHYNRAVFFMKKMHCDGGFESIMDEVADNLVIYMNYKNPDDHIPNI